MARLLPLIVLLMIQGVCCKSGWDVTYSSSHICPLKGSTVTINCTYKYPAGHHMTEAFWTKNNSRDPPNLFNDSEYRERIQYLGDKQHDCSVRLTNVRQTDSHKYYFRFITDEDKWIGAPGVTLDVTDKPVISINSSGVIVEGDSVNLTCSSESNPPVYNYSWFKEETFVGSGNIYRISNIRSNHSGEYKCKTSHTCGVKYSDSVTLNVLSHHSSYGLYGITAACGGLLVIAIIIVLILFIMRNRRVAKTGDAAVNQVNKQDDQSCAVKHVDLASESANCDDVQYESVKPQRLRGAQTTAVEASESRDPEELQYATVHYKRNTGKKRSKENENHYGNITNDKPDASVRSNEEDTLVIYSSVK